MRIAQLVANGINGDEKARIESGAFLALLERVDDDEIIILVSYASRYWNDQEWRDLHTTILQPSFVTLSSGRDELDASTFRELARFELQSLRLLRPKFKAPKKGEVPEFDEKTGMMKAGSRELTSLGQLLLKRIGLMDEDEY